MEQGVNLNMTLIFSLQRYREVAETYIKTPVQAERPASGLNPLAWLRFSSAGSTPKWDDLLLRGQYSGTPPPPGQAAIAQAKLAYRMYLDMYTDSPEWYALAGKRRPGAAPAVGLDLHQEPQLLRHLVC